MTLVLHMPTPTCLIPNCYAQLSLGMTHVGKACTANYAEVRLALYFLFLPPCVPLLVESLP